MNNSVQKNGRPLRIWLAGEDQAAHQLRLVYSLVKTGVELTLINGEELAARVKTEYGIDVPSVNWKRASLPGQSIGVIATLADHWNKFTLNILAKRYQSDLFHISYILPEYAYCVSLIPELPVVATLWGSDILEQKQTRNENYRNELKKLLSQAVVVTADAYNLFSAAEKLIFPKKISNKKTVYWGADTRLFGEKCKQGELSFWYRSLDLPENAAFCLSPRRTEPFYKVHDIVAAFSRMKKNNGLYLILKLYDNSNSEYVAQLKKIAKELEVYNQLRFWPPCRYEELVPPYQAAEFIINFPESDGMPSCFFEAMAAKAPIITNDLEAYNSSMSHEENCLKVKDGDVDELALSMDRLMADDSLKKLLSDNAFSWVRINAEWEHCVNNFIDAYYMAISRHIISTA